MPTSAQPGIIEKILKAESPEEVQKLVGFTCSTEPRPDKVLRRINRAAVKRSKELARP